MVQTTVGALGDSFTGPAGLYKAIIKEGPNGNNCKDSLMAEIIQPDLLQMVSLSNDTTRRAVITPVPPTGVPPGRRRP